MSYQPFLIADFKTGVQLNKEPWLIPTDAFTDIENAYIYEGVIIKRMGYTEFHQLMHDDPQDTSAYVEVDVGADRATVAAASITLTDLDDDEAVWVYKDFTANYFNGDDEFELDVKCTDGGTGWCGLWAITQDIDGFEDLSANAKNFLSVFWWNDKIQVYARSGVSTAADLSDALTVGTQYYLKIKVDRTAETLTCVIYSDANRSTVVDTVSVTLPDATDEYQYLYAVQGYEDAGGGGQTFSGIISNLSIISYPGNDVMGLVTFDRAAGTSEFIAFDELRVNRYNSSGERFEDISLTDNFSGGDDDWFHTAAYNDNLYIVNNVDPLHVYDGATVAQVDVDIDGGPNDLNSAMFVVNYKGRLLLFRTNEATDGACPQRVRWPTVGTVDYSGNDYVDAPTQDWITGVGFVGDHLIVYFNNSVWCLKYTGDATLPYRWENIATGGRGSAAQMSTIEFPDELITLSGTGLITCDSLDVDELIPQAPDITLNWALDSLRYCYGTYHGETRQYWCTYPATGETYANRILVYNHVEKGFSTYHVDAHCFGEYNVDLDLTWDEIEETWDELEWAWDDPTRAGGYPQIMMGARNGYTYVMNEGITDDGTSVEMRLLSGRWNPYLDKGFRTRLGYIDFLVESDPAITITVRLYKDLSGSHYATKTFTCDGTGDNVWKRIKVNTVAESHRIEILHSDDQQPKIHAIMPWFKKAGRIIS